MKQTGIIRRIDELGRIVIPKQFRSALRMDVGDVVEFNLEGDSLFIKKHSKIDRVKAYMQVLAQVFRQKTGLDILICDTDKIICAEGNSVEKYIGLKISNEFLTLLRSSKNRIFEEEPLIKITDNDDFTLKHRAVFPILCEGQKVGCLIILGVDKFEDSTLILASFCADILKEKL